MIGQRIVIPDCLRNFWFWLCRGSDVCSSVSSHVWLFRTSKTIVWQIPLFSIISQSLLKFMITESMMLSNHPIFCFPLLLLPSIFPSIKIFSKESDFHITLSKYWSFNFSIFRSFKISFHSNPKESQCQRMFSLYTVALISHARK